MRTTTTIHPSPTIKMIMVPMVMMMTAVRVFRISALVGLQIALKLVQSHGNVHES
jgi:hypothetical protein